MSIFGPEGDGKDLVVAKKHEHSLNVEAIGRYIVWYNEAEEKYIYYSVRPRKNIDIDTGKLIEIKNGIKTEDGEEAAVPHTRLDTSKDLYVMQINEDVHIPIIKGIGVSWSITLSFNPFSVIYPQMLFTVDTLGASLGFYTDQTLNIINFTYRAAGDMLRTFFYRINSKQLIHLSIEGETNKISLRVNGKPWCNVEFDYDRDLTYVNIYSGMEIGILSIYNRRLSKSEFIQHFIDYHVPNFTDDEVLI